ncbi:capsular polysaccharide biosynthsis protein [Lentisphaera araneosa HTCC2155]|uniref:Capsular polysaccharide biosynthsis protein n=1 Tax=Lentisphaera araneosa HTCC2155 TaxID=313628 RepID=A6DHF8_9BACT|nr:glycosyltransferase [Lentisphaera araneosa]EDM29041.1 capsular polysaccharide biosynthsis protein [Lentisphaera araneosa HTCC2155]
MKKILITASGLGVGGVERSLLGLLQALDCDKYDITLHLWSHDGELMDGIPQDIRLLPEDNRYAALERPIKDVLFSSTFPIALARLLAKFITWAKLLIFEKKSFLLLRSMRYSLPFLPSIEGEYDLGISFLTPHDPMLKKVRAKTKIGWIHTDYSTMECGVDHSFEAPTWGALDHIAAVSDGVRSTFLKVFPDLEERVKIIENIISPELIRQQASSQVISEEMPITSGEISVCSVGRFCYAKNFESIPAVVQLLGKRGLVVKWYLIGFGKGEALIREKIKDHNVENKVIILGKKTNPYPYIKACDIYVQPSRYEGKAVTVREAQILSKPVLIPNFPTAKSQLEDGVDGLICPLNTEGIAEGIITLIKDTQLRSQLAKGASSRDYSNRSELKKIYQLVDLD